MTFRSIAPFLALAVAAPAQAADTWEIDKGHSAVIFSAKHFNAGYTYGRFDDFKGSFTIDKANPANNKVHIEVMTASVNSGIPKRDDHLRNTDFFNAAQFPTIVFDSTKVVAKDADTVTVTGNLAMHGVTKAVTFDVDFTGEGDDPWGSRRMGAHAAFSLKRNDWGVSGLKDAVGDEIRLIVSLEGSRPKS
jgi:polyisoprenoid-binding protein YceI